MLDSIPFDHTSIPGHENLKSTINKALNEWDSQNSFKKSVLDPITIEEQTLDELRIL